MLNDCCQRQKRNTGAIYNSTSFHLSFFGSSGIEGAPIMPRARRTSRVRRRRRQLSEADLRLRMAVANGDISELRAWTSDGDVNELDCSGWSLLHLAASRGRERCVRVLLEHGALAAVQDSIGGFTSLHYAAMHGRTRIARLILDCQHSDAVINACSNDGWTPMHVAAHYGRDDFIRVLVDYRAKVDALSDKGTTPLQLALIRNRFSCVNLLLDAGADINIQSGFPLRYSVIKGYLPLGRTLLQRGAEPNLGRPEDGETPLHLAALKNDLNFAKLLYEFGGDVYKRNYDGQTPMATAKMVEDRSRPLLDFLQEESRCCRSLQNLCRLTIRRAIGHTRLDRIHQLPLSTVMLDFLRHKFED